MKKEIQLIRKTNGKLILIAIDEFFERPDYMNAKKVCESITPSEKLGLWIYEETHKGCASDGIGDEIKVRDITEKDIVKILRNKGKCYIEVDYNNELSIPRNGYGHGKIVIHLKK